MAVQIYGPNQTAGVAVVTTGKSAPKSDGALSYAQLVGLLGGDGSTPGSATNPVYVNSGGASYQLASSQTITSGGSTNPVTGVFGGSYIWNVVGTFSGGSTIALQALASDGASWVTIDSAVTGSGNVSVVLGNNATVRLLGAVASTTAVSSSLT